MSTEEEILFEKKNNEPVRGKNIYKKNLHIHKKVPTLTLSTRSVKINS